MYRFPKQKRWIARFRPACGGSDRRQPAASTLSEPVRAMNVVDLQYFVVSADAGTFARAAEILGLNTSTISRRIGRLEDELG